MNIVLHSVIVVLISCVTFGYGDILFKPNSGQPGNYGQNGQFGNIGLGQSGLPVQPGYNNQFGQQPGQFGQQPEQFGQQAGQFGLPVQPGYSNQFGQSGQAALPVQPGYNNQFGQVIMPGPLSQMEQPGISGSFNHIGQSGMPGQFESSVSSNNAYINSVHSEFERYQNLNKELEKKVIEMIQNKTIRVPPNFSQYSGPVQPQISQLLLPLHFPNVPPNIPLPSLPQPPLQPNPINPPWIPFQQNNQQLSNIRLHRSSPAEIQTLQSQGYQIVKLRDYQNFNQLPKPGFAFSGPNIGHNEQTSDKQRSSSLAKNSTLDASKNNSNDKEHKTDLRAASSEDDYIVGSPLQIHKHQQNIEQHHPVGKTDHMNTFNSNSSKEQELKDSELKNSASNSNKNPSNSLTRNNFTETSNSTKSGQPQLPNDKLLKNGTDGLKKRFGDDYIGLMEELPKNKTELSPTKAPAQVFYRAAFNGNPHNPLILSSSTKTMAVPVSTSNIYNYNPYNSYTPVNSAGRALYPLSNVWPRYATYNNNYQANLMNSMPRNLINPMNNFQKKLPYASSYYYNYQ
ncbi:type-2 histone deacetylase 1-like [Microplitis mediator]|uniref:type-2 histone deacetylase 1-like n=1 Tax=Microplitis mediator TaxID=375433 RepID=UPI0025538991|nr:type-2 histone deacetylase 1-like [Microplitis mediator]